MSAGVYGSLNLGGHVGDDPAAVAENRRRLAAALGVRRLTVADQQHTARVAVVDERLAGRGHDGAADAAAAFPATDAMITSLPGTALTILVADCAPVVLYDPVRRAAGVAHSGRAGTIKGVIPQTVKAMTATFGSDPADLLVGIGPAIGAASYEIGAAEAAEVMAGVRRGRSAAADPDQARARKVRPGRRDPRSARRRRRPRPERPRHGDRHQGRHGHLLLRPRRSPLRPFRGGRGPAGPASVTLAADSGPPATSQCGQRSTIFPPAEADAR